MEAKDVANIIERFIKGTGAEWEWDDFISSPDENPMIEKIRSRCAQLDSEFPPLEQGMFTNERGLEVLREFIRLLRAEDC